MNMFSIDRFFWKTRVPIDRLLYRTFADIFILYSATWEIGSSSDWPLQLILMNLAELKLNLTVTHRENVQCRCLKKIVVFSSATTRCLSCLDLAKIDLDKRRIDFLLWPPNPWRKAIEWQRGRSSMGQAVFLNTLSRCEKWPKKKL